MNSQLTPTIGSQGSIGTCGSQGLHGIIGSQGSIGTTGLQGTQITDWKNELESKYPRFTIKTEYDPMTMFAPSSTIQIIDKRTNEEYKFMSIYSNMSKIVEETEQFIQRLIVTIREDKINNIINGTES